PQSPPNQTRKKDRGTADDRRTKTRQKTGEGEIEVSWRGWRGGHVVLPLKRQAAEGLRHLLLRGPTAKELSCHDNIRPYNNQRHTREMPHLFDASRIYRRRLGRNI
ncbi:unnamed protein product, partial [Ectocarpus sp. 12 AP-2014]